MKSCLHKKTKVYEEKDSSGTLRLFVRCTRCRHLFTVVDAVGLGMPDKIEEKQEEALKVKRPSQLIMRVLLLVVIQMCVLLLAHQIIYYLFP